MIRRDMYIWKMRAETMLQFSTPTRLARSFSAETLLHLLEYTKPLDWEDYFHLHSLHSCAQPDFCVHLMCAK